VRSLLHDVRFAFRSLCRRPGFAAVAVLVLGLGIGANTAIFSVVDAVVLRPLPYANPEQLVVVGLGNQPGRPFRGTASWPTFRDWRDGSQALSDLAAYHGEAATLTGKGEPELVEAIATTANLFDLLGVKPALGRGFVAGEDRPGRNRVVVLSDGFWRRRFAGDPSIVGRNVTLGGVSYTVIGVTAAGFQFPPTEFGGEIWVPTPFGALDEAPLARHQSHLQMVGRLRSGITLLAAEADLRAVHAEVERRNPSDRGLGLLTAAPLHGDLIRNVKTPLFTLLLAVGFVLLVACANVANLLLARATVRRQELAVRAALGASRWRIARLLLTESLMLGTIGGALGVALAFWTLDGLLSLLPASLPRPRAISIDSRVLLFTAATALATSLLFGILPALASVRSDVQSRLSQVARTTTGPGRWTTVLLVAEVAISFLLLVGAGLTGRSFLKVAAAHPGFDSGRLLTAEIQLPDRYFGGQIDNFYRELMSRLDHLPGAEGAALVLPVPYSRSNINPDFGIPGRPKPAQGRRAAPLRFVSPGYFQVMGIRLAAGRPLLPADDSEGAQPVVVVSESFARAHFPGEAVVGRQIELGGKLRQIVGVAQDVKPRLDAPGWAGLYTPFAQPFIDIPLRARTVVVRAPEPAAMARAIPAEVSALDRLVPVREIFTMDRRVSDTLQQRRLITTLLGLFALLALVLAATGIYGVTSYAVSQRVRELGLRMALGASNGRVLRMVLGQGLRRGLAGLAVGVAAAVALGRLLTSQLYGISATDPLTFMALGALLLAVTLISTLLPARRATRVDPMIALKSD
jgi:putative ABC transport system permease protein